MTVYFVIKKNLGLDPHSEKMSRFRFGFSEFILLGNQGKYIKTCLFRAAGQQLAVAVATWPAINHSNVK